MKSFKFIMFLILSATLTHAQVYYGLDQKKLNNYLKNIEIDEGYTFDTLTYYNGFLGTFKMDYNEIILSINSLEEALQVRGKDKLSEVKGKNRNYLYFENEVISVIYYDDVKKGVTAFLTCYLSSKEKMLQMMEKLNPEKMLNEAWQK
ncbi:MAG TPA: hypothetical protein P5050_01950 [Bacteroidia bacterium]|nr:hypothetical protein [Bacteroidia bacterium]HRS57966.1 hypothetical protein [Bacteroidia bacterium]HRU68009.1 hypothetical protein [Bacteroidia bacterium]